MIAQVERIARHGLHVVGNGAQDGGKVEFLYFFQLLVAEKCLNLTNKSPNLPVDVGIGEIVLIR